VNSLLYFDLSDGQLCAYSPVRDNQNADAMTNISCFPLEIAIMDLPFLCQSKDEFLGLDSQTTAQSHLLQYPRVAKRVSRKFQLLN
jgi:hypothetical protein